MRHSCLGTRARYLAFYVMVLYRASVIECTVALQQRQRFMLQLSEMDE